MKAIKKSIKSSCEFVPAFVIDVYKDLGDFGHWTSSYSINNLVDGLAKALTKESLLVDNLRGRGIYLEVKRVYIKYKNKYLKYANKYGDGWSDNIAMSLASLKKAVKKSKYYKVTPDKALLTEIKYLNKDRIEAVKDLYAICLSIKNKQKEIV